MGEAIALAVIGALAAVAAMIATVHALSRPKAKHATEEYLGRWRRCLETVAGRDTSIMRIVLIREYEGRETGRLVVAEIPSGAPDFASKLQTAMAEADIQLATLESGDRP
jgi:hypothetical protein